MSIETLSQYGFDDTSVDCDAEGNVTLMQIDEFGRTHQVVLGSDMFNTMILRTLKPMPTPSSAFDNQEGGSHYKALAIQPVEYMMANAIPFMEGCVIKYATRWRDKGGIEDLRKARHFLDMLIEREEAQPPF